ncbi:MAG TPA: ABC transporter substrate-binding protein, partial [Candidatus Methylomirabilis sp.]|nr:ABC transporter substrate-binding protein [Candidatus Methylomirabilis sp.]
MRLFRIWRRMIFIAALAPILLAAPVLSYGQQPGKVYQIGYLGAGPPAPNDTTPQYCPLKGNPNWQAWLEGLRERGYIPGQNLGIECRYTQGRAERAPALAVELVSLKPDLLVAFSTANVRAAKQATSTLPIVMVGVIDPVGRGLIASLAQPGGNVTGLSDTFREMEGKRLQLLKEAVPTVTRIAVLSHPGSGGLPEPVFQRDREAAALALGLTLQVYDIRDPADFEGAFAAMTKARAEAVFVAADPFWGGHRQRIVDLAAQHRLPAIYHDRDFVPAGGLLAYDVSQPAIFRRLGFYVDKIFKGANPGDLPVEQPTKFDLLINGKTAKAL